MDTATAPAPVSSDRAARASLPTDPATLRRRCEQQEDEIRRLRQRLARDEALLSNAALKPGARVYLYWAKRDIEDQQTRQPGQDRYRIRQWRIAQRSGLSESTCTDLAKFGEKCGAWEGYECLSGRALAEYLQSQGQDPYAPDAPPRVTLAIPRLLLTAPGKMAPPPDDPNCRPPRKCRDCASLHLIRRTYVVCGDCGAIQEQQDTLVNGAPVADSEPDPYPSIQGIGTPASLEAAVAAWQPPRQMPTFPTDPAPPSVIDEAPTWAARMAAFLDSPDDAPFPGPPAPLPLDSGDTPPAAPTPENWGIVITNNHQGGGIPENQGYAPSADLLPAPDSDAALLAAAAALLAQLAGEGPRHIVMQAKGPHKYEWRHGPITPALAARHLAGRVTIGADLWHPGGQCRALAWDADDAPGWARLWAAAWALKASGAYPLLEPSPTGGAHAGGGHLWLLFDDLVDAEAAHAWARAVAPDLAAIAEAWPRPAGAADAGAQAVRLPGGRYRRGAVDAPCPLDGPRRAPQWLTDPYDVAALLWAGQTPASWVPPAPPAPAPPHVTRTAPPAAPERASTAPASARPLPAAWSDPTWQAKHGTQAAGRWFWHTPAEIAAWFATQHTLDSLHPANRDGYALATWRGEQEPSVKYSDRETWIDYGASARRADGKPDNGDALELWARLQGISRAEALRRQGVALIAAARAALEAAARAGQEPPAWVGAITSPAGWAHYDAIRGGADGSASGA